MNVVEDDWVDVNSSITSQPLPPQPQPQPQQQQHQNPQTQNNVTKELEEKLQQSLSMLDQHQRLSQQERAKQEHRIQELQQQLTETQNQLTSTQVLLHDSQQHLSDTQLTIQQQKTQITQLVTLISSSSSSARSARVLSSLAKQADRISIQSLKRHQSRFPLSNTNNKVLAVTAKAAFRQQSGAHRSSYSQDRHSTRGSKNNSSRSNK